MDTNLLQKRLGRAAETDSQIAVLNEVSQIFDRELSTHVALRQILEILKNRYCVIRGVIALLDAESGEIRIDVSVGLPDAGRFASYRLGEGITGKVVQSGRPIIVPQVSREPMF